MDPTSVCLSYNFVSKEPHPELCDRTRIDHVDAHLNCPNRLHDLGG